MFSRPLANTALEIQFCFGNILNKKLPKRFGADEPDDGSGVAKTITRRYADPAKIIGIFKRFIRVLHPASEYGLGNSVLLREHTK